MLKDTNFDLKEGTIYGLRLDTVGEIIAKVVSVRDTEVLVQQPLQLAQMQDGNVGFVPAFPLANKSKPIVIPRSGLLFFEASVEVVAGYESATSGIVVPKKSPIITK